MKQPKRSSPPKGLLEAGLEDTKHHRGERLTLAEFNKQIDRPYCARAV